MTETTSHKSRHALKAPVLAEWECPSAVIAAVAMAHGVNANLVHKWRARAEQRQEMAMMAPRCILRSHVLTDCQHCLQAAELRIELRRRPLTATVN
jgi:transposase